MEDRTLLLENANDIKLVGGKAKVLSELVRVGFRVPKGFVVPTTTTEMSQEVTKEIYAAFDKLGYPLVAVRSSAIAEDGIKDAWAGQMDSFLNVDRDNLISMIGKCWQSAKSERAKAYAVHKGVDAGQVAVVVQVMVNGDISGVAFSVNPISKNRGELMIEAVKGLADNLVSGIATPDNYIYDRSAQKLLHQIPRQNEPLMKDSLIKEVAETVIKLEEYFATPVDVEWTIADSKLYILQARPITTLS